MLIQIQFDGGCWPNPGPAYGSYLVKLEAGTIRKQRLTLGDDLSNNEAEYWTLIKALEETWDCLGNGPVHAGVRFEIESDSDLVVNQVLGKWKCKARHLKTLRDRVRELFYGFPHTMKWISRDKNVQLFGH